MPQYVGYQLTENINGSITVEYTPTTPGIHKISIDCNGSAVGSMPLWCVVQRADYGYITSYGQKLLEILSQPGFADVLEHEGLGLVQDGETITVLTKEAATGELNNSEIKLAPDEMPSAATSILQVVSAINDTTAKQLDAALNDLAWNKDISENSSQVKQEPDVSEEPLSRHHEEQISMSEFTSDNLLQPKKDMFPCPFEGCPKTYGKEIYAKRCELDHQRQKRRQSNRTRRKRASSLSSDGKEGDLCSIEKLEQKKDDEEQIVESTAALNDSLDEGVCQIEKESRPRRRRRRRHHDNMGSPAGDSVKRSRRTPKPTWKMLEMESSTKSGRKSRSDDSVPRSPDRGAKKQVKQNRRISDIRDVAKADDGEANKVKLDSDDESAECTAALEEGGVDPDEPSGVPDKGKDEPDDFANDDDNCEESQPMSLNQKRQTGRYQRSGGRGRRKFSHSSRFACSHDGCGRTFKTVAARAIHTRRIHGGVKRDPESSRGITYKCTFIGCGNAYSTASNLRKHIRSNEHFADGKAGQDDVASEDDVSSGEETKHQISRDIEKMDEDRKQFPCTYDGCGKVFGKIHHLQRHKNSHKAFPFQCHEEGCKKLFRFEESLSLHKFSYHGMKDEVKRFECELCDKRFSSWCLLKKHQRVHTLETPYQCQDCLQRFKWQTSLLTHACLNKSGEGASLKCPECGKIFNMRCLLKKHMVIHTNVRPFKCDQCDKAFKMRETLKKHHRKVHWSEAEKRKYAEKRGWICPDCDKVCTSVRDFHRHRTKHSDLRPFICDQCARQFKTQDGLNAHLKQMHSVTLIQKEDGSTEAVRTLNYFACDFPDCDKKFRRHHMYLEHKKIHYSSEHIPCDHPGCNKTYPTLFKMKEHKRSVHKDRPPVFCQVCGKRMKNTSCLSNHMKLHSQINRIRCEYPGCDKSFTARTTLDRHILMKHQTPTKLYECTYENCNKSFKLKCLLEQHLQSHNTQRNFRCEVCNNTYKTPNTLRSHIRTHDKSKQHRCMLCGKHFPRKNRYLTHLATHHADEVQVITTGDSIALENIEQIDLNGEQVQYLKPDSIIQTVTDTGETEVATFSTIQQVIGDEKPDISYQDSIILPNTQIIEFTTNYQ